MDYAALEAEAQRVLDRVPGYIWDGKTLPVPVEQIADSCFGLLVSDMQYLQVAPGAPELPDGHDFSGLLLPTRREIWVNAEEARDGVGMQFM